MPESVVLDPHEGGMPQVVTHEFGAYALERKGS